MCEYDDNLGLEHVKIQKNLKIISLFSRKKTAEY